MASVSFGSRDCHQGEASMEAEAREMSHLTTKEADISRHAFVAALRFRCTVDVADWFGHAAEAVEMSCRTVNAA